jgi:hypothetical protein
VHILNAIHQLSRLSRSMLCVPNSTNALINTSLERGASHPER